MFGAICHSGLEFSALWHSGAQGVWVFWPHPHAQLAAPCLVVVASCEDAARFIEWASGSPVYACMAEGTTRESQSDFAHGASAQVTWLHPPRYPD